MIIEIIYALPNDQTIHRINYIPGMTALMALEQSGLLKQYPELNINNLTIGVFSEKINLETILNPNDRLEIYRPITADPKIRRQARVRPVGKWESARKR